MMIAIQVSNKGVAGDVRANKKAIMESLRPLQEEDIIHNVVLGQYIAGELNGNPVIGYADEQGVSANSRIETFMAARLWIDDYFWNKVPIYIRTGKRLKEKATRIVIEFKETLTE
ncbi:hypothetical protein [Paenibacillus crassostreae]|nr:hypothetical protein [Paenibacillus crassostreae]AOZ90752.1 hypothetical protein LPB68_00015 [Paenibacillus crassostreae]